MEPDIEALGLNQSVELFHVGFYQDQALGQELLKTALLDCLLGDSEIFQQLAFLTREWAHVSYVMRLIGKIDLAQCVHYFCRQAEFLGLAHIIIILYFLRVTKTIS